jgi:polyisoprenoid-binding protein YceI
MRIATGVLAVGLALAFMGPAGEAAEKPALYAGHYEADPAHSQVMFITSHMGLSTFIARFDQYTTDLDLDPADFSKSHLAVTVKPASVDINLPVFAEHMGAPEWFDTARYPDMTFVSTRFDAETPTTGKVTGDLTIRGITHPVTLDVRLVGVGIDPLTNVPAFGIEARGIIKRSQYGMTADLPLIPDTVRIWVNAQFEQKTKG